jgi:hypothetical protein
MLDRIEIEAALAREDTEELRDVFDALVGWTGASEVTGVADAEAVMGLFRRVCTALRGDDAQPPPETLRALLQAGRAPGSPPPRSYDDAARMALAAQRTWWPVFAASFEGRDGA